MKNKLFSMGIKTNLTILFSVSIFLLVFISLTLLIVTGKGQKEAEIKNQLINTVESNTQKITTRNNLIILDSSYVFKNNIYTSLYDEKQRFIYGETPPDFPNSITFEAGKLKKVGSFYVYDITKKIQGQNIIVRGIVSIISTKQTFSSLFYSVLAVLPILAIITVLLARLFIRKTFLPIEQIIHVAQQIQNSKNLSLRIRLNSNTKDEIHALANTFDSMFDSLEQAFLKEKQFTSDASHEIRTPTSVIIAQCELTLENTHEEKTKEALKTILQHAKKMSQMTNQLLLLTKAEHHTEILEKETINISELAEIIAEQQKELAEENGLSLTWTIENDIYMIGDPTLLSSALINLFSNAIAYNKPNGKISFSLSHSENFIQGRIFDTGIGISEKDLPKIWERFYQVDKARTKRKDEYNGTGLGLPLVKWIIEAHGGTIAVSSSINKGTIFNFTFPEKI